MPSKEELQRELTSLVVEGHHLVAEAPDGVAPGYVPYVAAYQSWYTKALRLLDMFARDRLAEFRGYYESDSKRRALLETTYSIQDFISGINAKRDTLSKKPLWSVRNILQFRIGAQTAILKSLESRIVGILASLEATIAAEIEDASLASAERLKKVNLRAAGVLAGVVLEDHLQRVLAARGISPPKKNQTLAELNEALKQAGAYEIPVWRRIQYMADLRNLCAHKKDSDPTAEHIDELLAGTHWVVMNIS